MRRTPTFLLGMLFLLLAGGARAEAPQDQTPHWSFRKRTHPEVPRFAVASDRSWVRTPVDAFLLQRLRREGLKPCPEAERATLIRRLSFDLTGLPPTPAEIAAFVAAPAPDAYERLVDRLLASPRYGEQWGRHWLDVVRFAETEGFEYDRARPGAWRYRDYVIRRFHRGQALRPFRPGATGRRRSRRRTIGTPRSPLASTGSVPVRRNAGNPDVAFSRHEVLTEMTDALGVVFLGLTVGCARCHDHKFDAIPQADYYRLQAFLAAAQENDIVLVDAATQRRLADTDR